MNPICWLTRRRLGAYQDGELGPAIRAKTEAHLHRCRLCTAELARLVRLRAALTAPIPEPPEAVWQAFWPQVRARLAVPSSEPSRRWSWETVAGHRRLALGSALAAAALVVVVALSPWDRVAERSRVPVVQGPGVVASSPGGGAPIPQVLIQSVETADPQSSVMVFTNPESDVTIVWVFGLERTDT